MNLKDTIRSVPDFPKKGPVPRHYDACEGARGAALPD